MPAGCDFICQNLSCDQYASGFVMSAPWPMGKIELLIGALESKISQKDTMNHLMAMKNDGHKYACLILPNIDKIETVAYRINMWSPETKCIWKFDVELNGKSLEEALPEANLPTTCPKTNSRLMSFNEVSKEGIDCPHCGQKLIQNRWFTNEN